MKKVLKSCVILYTSNANTVDKKKSQSCFKEELTVYTSYTDDEFPLETCITMFCLHCITTYWTAFNFTCYIFLSLCPLFSTPLPLHYLPVPTEEGESVTEQHSWPKVVNQVKVRECSTGTVILEEPEGVKHPRRL